MSPNNTDTYGTQEEFNNLPNDNCLSSRAQS